MMIMIIIIVKGARTQQREQRAAVAGSVARDWWSLRRSCRGCHDSGPTQSGNSKGAAGSSGRVGGKGLVEPQTLLQGLPRLWPNAVRQQQGQRQRQQHQRHLY